MSGQRKTSKRMLYFNLIMTFVWIGLIIPTVFLWKDSLLWVLIMSAYANIVGHWSAYQACRAEVQAEGSKEPEDEPEADPVVAST